MTYLYHTQKSFKGRVTIIGLSISLIFMIVCYRAGRIYVSQGDELRTMAQRQQLRKIEQIGQRGVITDRNGAPLAISVKVDSIYADPKLISKPRKTARLLAKVLGEDLRYIFKKIANEKHFTWIKRQVSPETADKVRKLNLRGIGITKEGKRFYPNREMAASILGFVGIDGKGLEGVELQFEQYLKGTTVNAEALRDGRGRLLALNPTVAKQTLKGSTVTLTIDKTIQHISESALRRATRIYGAKAGSVIVMDNTNGHILALCNEPHFNPNSYSEYSVGSRRNRAITDPYEPGSVFKSILMASALENNTVTPYKKLPIQSSSIKVGNYYIKDLHHHANLTATDTLVYSSNVGAASIALKLGRDAYSQKINDFGFGNKTGIELPGESSGILQSPHKWPDIQLANIGFGHGIAVTTIQLAAAYSSIATGGLYYKPQIIKSWNGKDGLTPWPQVQPKRVITEQTANQLTKMLTLAVKKGTGRRAKLAEYTTAGKTGTAQKPDRVSGGYADDKYIAVFAGFVPAEAPRLTIVVSVDEPQVEHQGGVVSAPIFKEIAYKALKHLLIPATSHQPLAQNDSRSPENAIERSEKIVMQGSLSHSASVTTVPTSLQGYTLKQAMQKLSSMHPDVHIKTIGTGLVQSYQLLPKKPGEKAVIVLKLQEDATTQNNNEKDMVATIHEE